MPWSNMPKLSLKIGGKEFLLETTIENKKTLSIILRHLPVVGEARRWGKEIYFLVPFDIALEHGRLHCEPGELGFWPEGPAIALFFGKTPVSDSGRPRAFSPCNFFARLLDGLDKAALDSVLDGEKIVLSKAKQAPSST